MKININLSGIVFVSEGSAHRIGVTIGFGWTISGRFNPNVMWASERFGGFLTARKVTPSRFLHYRVPV